MDRAADRYHNQELTSVPNGPPETSKKMIVMRGKSVNGFALATCARIDKIFILKYTASFQSTKGLARETRLLGQQGLGCLPIGHQSRYIDAKYGLISREKEDRPHSNILGFKFWAFSMAFSV